MTNPRQLAPTVGPTHGGIEFLEGAFLGFEKIAIGHVTKSGRGRIYLRDWGVRDHPDHEKPELKAPHQTNRFHVDAAKFSTASMEGSTLLTNSRDVIYKIGSRCELGLHLCALPRATRRSIYTD